MSVIMITKHNESIYDINRTMDENVIQVSNYHTAETNFKKNYVAEQKRLRKLKKPFGVMGLTKQPLPNPKCFLKKRTGKPPMVVPRRDLIPKDEKSQFTKRAPVPTTDCCIRDQMDKMHHNKINFVHENIKSVLKMKPKVPERRQVLDVHGDYKVVPKLPAQVSNKLFAKIPRYLEIVIKERQAQLENSRDTSGIKESKCKYITRDERKTLLDGLKKNWDELQRTYQGLPILTDTIPKKMRKTQIERELQQLEKDIVLIERHPFIYVYDDEDGYTEDSDYY